MPNFKKIDQKVLNVLKEKAEYHDVILKSPIGINTTQIAKELEMSPNALNKKLHDLKIIYPTNKKILLGYFMLNIKIKVIKFLEQEKTQRLIFFGRKKDVSLFIQ
ncbi:phage antirepressor KilAC domain protein [Kurthia sp. 11kri321]|uniref:phage antirepressor KilAC domain-containing protein n=1 Tax=Kurthia sp. 11kri321 TaxID=1750719 RepID=UPI000745B8B3|nr:MULTISPECIES: phage antirepressor KilAC domain-containing protein [Kurthia]AMA63666.1 phage antirepressor KilAC domain protein [Kurthia sp. 11kri321]MEB6113342.1 phage antirepressor KilAC domain-containing protein [Kurthia gibsonii]